MSKNMTRKGLAFGAGLALIGSGIVALPAQAAGAITLNPSAGTTFNTLTTSTFSVSPVITGVNADEYPYLRYLVTNPDEKLVSFNLKQAGTNDGELFYASESTTDARIVTVSSLQQTDGGAGLDTFAVTLPGPASNYFETGDAVVINTTTAAGDVAAPGVTIVANAAAADTAGEGYLDGNKLIYKKAAATIAASVADTAEAGTATLTASDTNARTALSAFVVTPDALNNNNAAALGGVNELILDPSDNQKQQTYTVRAWLDGNQNNKIDTGEIASSAVTVTFKEIGKLTAVSSISGVRLGSTSVTTSVTLSGDINYQQVGTTDVIITLTQVTTDRTAAGGVLTWDAVNGVWSNTATGLTLAAGEVFTAKVYGDNDFSNTGTAQANAGDLKHTSTATVGTATSDPTQDLRIVASANAVTTTAAQDDPDVDGTGYGNNQAGQAYVRTGTASVELRMFVGTDAATPIGVSGEEVSIAVSSTNVTNTDLVKVGGKTVTGGVASILGVTNANGIATWTVELGAADAGDRLVFTPSISGVATGAALTLDVTDGDYTLSQLIPGSPSIKEGSSFSIEYRAADQFGVAPKNNTMSVLVSPTANERSTAADWSYSIPVVDGKAVLTVTDNGKGAGKFTAAAKLVTNGTATAVTNGSVDVVVNVVADPAAATLTLEKLTYGTAQANDANNDGDFADTGDTDNTGALLVESRTFADYDSRYALPTVDAPTVRDTYKVVVGAKATNAAAAAVVGAPVTFSAAGMLFKSGTRFVKDSITVHAGSTGIASVEVWSSVGGAREVKITSGTATATQKLTFAAGTGSAGSFTVSAPATASAGTTADVSVKVLDSLGNPAKGVTVTLFSKGPGYLINTTGTTLTDGTFSTKLLIGSNDSGTAVVSAVVTIAGVETIKTSEIKIGAAAGKVNVASFNGKLVVYAAGLNGAKISWKVGGKWGVGTATSNYTIFNRPTPVSGVTVSVDVYVNGVKTLTKSVVTR